MCSGSDAHPHHHSTRRLSSNNNCTLPNSSENRRKWTNEFPPHHISYQCVRCRTFLCRSCSSFVWFFSSLSFFFSIEDKLARLLFPFGKCATTTTPITMGICCTSDRFLMCIRLAMLLIFDARGKLHYARTEKIVKFSIWQRNKCSLIHRSTSFSTLHN